MSKKRAITAAIVAITIVVLFAGYQWFSTWSLDPENEAKADTHGMIAALEVTDDGLQAVAFTSDGNEKKAPASPKGKEDRELSWGATGSHIFISSNREEDSYNIYRWNPVTGAFDRRTRGSRSKAAPHFLMDGTVDSLRKGLVAGGGAVSVYDPKMMTLEQILPPLERGSDMSDEGGGMVGPMSGIYKKLGDSFKSSRYAGDSKTIYSLMRREGGEVLILSRMEPVPMSDGTQAPPPPVAVFAGRKLAWDLAQDGSGVVSIIDFQWPDPENVPTDFVKNGEPVAPFTHALLSLPLPGQQAQGGPITVFPPKGVRAGDIAVSPDGKMVAVVIGEEAEEIFTPKALVVFPNKPNGGSEAIPLANGAISSPSWSPDSSEIVFLKNTGGKRGIFRVSASGSGVEMRVGGSDKDYRSPKFSPQTAP